MNRTCSQCGKTIDGEGIAFCPYCGAKLAAEPAKEIRNEEAAKWVRKALAVTSYPERREILLKGLEACPDSREIAWELLFVGEEAPKKGRVIDFSVIKSWVLEIYRDPKIFPEAKKDEMRMQFFDSPKLTIRKRNSRNTCSGCVRNMWNCSWKAATRSWETFSVSRSNGIRKRNWRLRSLK